MQTGKWKCRLKCHPSPRKETTRYFSSGTLLGFICLQEHLWVIQGKFSLCHHNAWALLRALMVILCLNPNAVLSSYVSVCSVSLQVWGGCSEAGLHSSGVVGRHKGYRWDLWPWVVPAPWFMLPFCWIWYHIFLCLSFSLSKYQPFLN